MFVVALLSVALSHEFTLASKTFAESATMPLSTVYGACGGGNRPPELHWSGAPAGTKSFALTIHDPDAPAPGGWWHWVVFNIPASRTNFNLTAESTVTPWIDGTSSFNTRGYGGPCPPPGRPHHYNFTLYALDMPNVPGASSATTGPDLLKSIEGHVLAKTTLTGLYGR